MAQLHYQLPSCSFFNRQQFLENKPGEPSVFTPSMPSWGIDLEICLSLLKGQVPIAVSNFTQQFRAPIYFLFLTPFKNSDKPGSH